MLNNIKAHKNHKYNKPTKTHEPPVRGFVFGKSEDNNYIIKPENKDGHIMVIGGVGSGKSSCIAMPTIRAWQSRIFAIDIKGELSQYASRYRSRIKVFSPQNASTYTEDTNADNKVNTYGYDPYTFLHTTPNQNNTNSTNLTQEAKAIAQSLIPLPPETKDPFWIDSAQTLLTGAILHYYTLKYSFIDTLKEIQQNGAKSLVETINTSPDDDARLFMGGFVDMSDKTLSGIFAELSRNIITLVTDNDIVSALSNPNIIQPADLEYGYDIFLNIPEHLLRQWKNLLSLMVNQFLLFFERRSDKSNNKSSNEGYNNINNNINNTNKNQSGTEKEKHTNPHPTNHNQAHNTTSTHPPPILFLLDEYPRLGKIPSIIDALATLRSKNITICLILQSLAQLDMIYGISQRKVIADTCAYKAILSATDPETQEYFSKLVGTYEKTKKSHGVSFDPLIGLLGRGKSENTTTEEKRIIKPEEFATLKDIVLLHPFGAGFLRVGKVPYYLMEGEEFANLD